MIPTVQLEKMNAIMAILKERVLDSHEIATLLYEGLRDCFGFTGVNIYLTDPSTYQFTETCPDEVWPIPDQEKEWLIRRTKELMIKNSGEPLDHFYISDRKASFFTSKEQLRIDQKHYSFSCDDALYWVLVSEDEMILGIVFINNWAKKKLLYREQHFLKSIRRIRTFVGDIVIALENHVMHHRIESLLTDKKEMKERIQKDEENLKNRILELSVLYDTSNSLGNALTYYQVIYNIMDAVYKVLNVDTCSILLLDFTVDGEVFIRINKPMDETLIKSVQKNILNAIRPFIGKQIDPSKVTYLTEKRYDETTHPSSYGQLRSFANVPLAFKDKVVGILNVCSTLPNAFARNEMTFLHTIANQLSSHLGRLKMLKELEKSKIGTMIHSMAEGVIMLDDNNHLEMINPAARKLLNFEEDEIASDQLIAKLSELDLLTPYYEAVVRCEPVLNYDAVYGDKILSTNVTPVMDVDLRRVGMVLVLRDVTELEKMNRIKTQRLEIISKVNLIINSIADLENLLAFLIEFILNVANAEMGSIQLKDRNQFLTKIHSNFPDKIREGYSFVTGETISDYVLSMKDLCFIENYNHNPSVSQSTKILIDSYVCIPIVVKGELIGAVNIVRKLENQSPKLTMDDIETLTTITSLSGTAISNALLYQETLKKQKLDQELKVAHQIQQRLLPSQLPILEAAHFGAVSSPAREIGGDYYDFFELEDGKIGIVLADIIGKGVPAALLMVMVKSIMQTHIQTYDSPKAALEKINNIIYNDPAMKKYVPLFYGIFDPKAMVFKYCNAGHEPGILFTNGNFVSLDTDGFPTGAWPDSAYEEKEIHLQDHDTIVLFTDGIIEARNEKGKDFGFRRLKALIKRCESLNAEESAQKVRTYVQQYTGHHEQHDDLTVVFVKIGNFTIKKDEVVELSPPSGAYEIRVTSAKKNIGVIRREVERIALELGFDHTDIYNIKLSVNEAQANIIEHAYHGNEEQEIFFRFLVFADRLTIVIKDFGKGIEQKTIKGEKHLEELEGSGLGVFLINKLMDEVEYKKSTIGTELWLTKYRKGDWNGNS